MSDLAVFIWKRDPNVISQERLQLAFEGGELKHKTAVSFLLLAVVPGEKYHSFFLCR